MESQNSTAYIPVPDEEGEKHQILGQPVSKVTSTRVKVFAALALVTALILALFLLPHKYLFSHRHNHEETPKHNSTTPNPALFNFGKSPCGHDRAAALENGCIFDLLAYAWVPSQCYDEELTWEFQNLSDWQYYIDHKPATQTVPLSEVSRGEHHHLFVSWEWHLMHCVYIWKRLQRAAMPDGPVNGVDIVTANMAHTDHCQRNFMRKNAPELSEINTRVRLKYLDCTMFR